MFYLREGLFNIMSNLKFSLFLGGLVAFGAIAVYLLRDNLELIQTSPEIEQVEIKTPLRISS